MTERDAFEIRFHAAVRGYAGRVSSDLDPAELAHEIAAAKPRRSGLAAAALGRTGLAAPRLAWILLLVAGLFAATVGGLLVSGSWPQPERPAVVPGIVPAFECAAGSSPNVPGQVGQARPPMDFVGGAMAFDRRAGRIVMLAEPDPIGPADPVQSQTWTFDVCTNTWTRMADGPVDTGGWGPLAYDVDSDLTITIDGVGRVWAYDLARDTWTAKGFEKLTNPTGQGRPRLVYDPVSGNVIRAYAVSQTNAAGSRGNPDLWTYDVETDTWSAITAGGFTSNVLIAYDAAADRVVTYDFGDEGPSTRLFDLRRGTWAESAHSPKIAVGWFATGNEIAYDEAARRTVIYGVGGMIAYDASADQWSRVIDAGPFASGSASGSDSCPGPRCRTYATTVYDPVNERLVIYGGQYQDPSLAADANVVQDNSVLAFDLTTRTWSVLLEADSIQQPQ
jgi:hypothetical protein